jgi:hypothetical protein
MAERTHSEGWITYAAIMAGIAGAVNAIFGIAAMFRLGRFSSPDLIFASLYAFGLGLLVFGAAQILASVFLVRRNAVARVGAIVLASVSIVFWCLWLGNTPTAALVAILLDALVIFGLSVTKEYFTSA